MLAVLICMRSSYLQTRARQRTSDLLCCMHVCQPAGRAWVGVVLVCTHEQLARASLHDSLISWTRASKPCALVP